MEFFPQAPRSWAGVSCVTLQDKGSQKKVGALSEAGGSGKGEVKEMDTVCGGTSPRDHMIRKKPQGQIVLYHTESGLLSPSPSFAHPSLQFFVVSLSTFPQRTTYCSRAPTRENSIHTTCKNLLKETQAADIHCSLQPKAPLWDHGDAYFLRIRGWTCPINRSGSPNKRWLLPFHLRGGVLSHEFAKEIP